MIDQGERDAEMISPHHHYHHLDAIGSLPSHRIMSTPLVIGHHRSPTVCLRWLHLILSSLSLFPESILIQPVIPRPILIKLGFQLPFSTVCPSVYLLLLLLPQTDQFKFNVKNVKEGK